MKKHYKYFCAYAQGNKTTYIMWGDSIAAKDCYAGYADIPKDVLTLRLEKFGLQDVTPSEESDGNNRVVIPNGEF